MLTRLACVRRGVPIFIAGFSIYSALAADESHGRLGTYCYPLAPAELRAYGVSGPGSLVMGVYSGTAAAQAGLQAGDLIVELNSTPIKSDDELIDALKRRTPGEQISLVFVRRAAQTLATVRLSPPAENINAETFKMAEAGLSWAQFELGLVYSSGEGAKQDYTKAR